VKSARVSKKVAEVKNCQEATLPDQKSAGEPQNKWMIASRALPFIPKKRRKRDEKKKEIFSIFSPLPRDGMCFSPI
jgi:hypothetical protein